MAFPSRSTVPLLITNSKKEFDIVYGSNRMRYVNITSMYPVDYVNVRELPFSRRREGLSYMFQCIVRSKSSYRCRCILIEFAVEAFHCGHMRNCEDESCILNDRYRITIVESLQEVERVPEGLLGIA
ncbi:hypothetical protein T03_8744 [Trichinella britovi]|uniref:Uncharacterized protein n=1 Tax=Trichinella britovi TaxID=45882 RepID=A0A0V1DJD5_TRIBR|nr:hypothetical protein T03_8744 [Trichinella britovi]